jgi:hypothetical protein
MTQLGLNILGITDAHLPPDLIDKARTTIRRVFPPDTAIIMFPTTRPAPNSYRQNTMGGQFFIVDYHWAKWVGYKRVEPSGLALVASIRFTYAHTTLTVIQAMVPPYSKEPFSMWTRLKAYLEARGSPETPRQYIMNIISRWHLSELVSGRPTVILGDFNQTADKLTTWQTQHDLARAHHNIHQITQHLPPRPLCTYERSNSRTHIDHIFHSHLGPIQLTQIGATDHPHILEKTDHYPIWIGLLWPDPLTYTSTPPTSPPIVNRPDISTDDPTAVQSFTSTLEQYVKALPLDQSRISSLTPERASQYQAAIMSNENFDGDSSQSPPYLQILRGKHSC